MLPGTGGLVWTERKTAQAVPGRYAGSFAIGTMEEFGEAVTDNGFAFVGMDAFFAWGLSELRGEQEST